MIVTAVCQLARLSIGERFFVTSVPQGLIAAGKAMIDRALTCFVTDEAGWHREVAHRLPAGWGQSVAEATCVGAPVAPGWPRSALLARA
jgi:hypothetical protein